MNLSVLGVAGSQNMIFLIFIILMFVGMYFLSIKPQKKMQAQRAEMLKNMKTGDSVLTIGGMKGKVDSINKDANEVVLDIDGVFLTFDLAAIRKVTNVAVSTSVEEEKTEEDK